MKALETARLKGGYRDERSEAPFVLSRTTR